MKKIYCIFVFVSVISFILNNNHSQAQWVQVTNGMSSTNGIPSFTVKGDTLFAGTAMGVFMTTNSGANWIEMNNGFSYQSVTTIITAGSNLFCGNILGIFKSTNNGALWSQVLNNVIVTSLTYNGSRIFAGTEGHGVYMSTNNGLNWSQVNNGITNLNIKALSSFSHTFAGTQSSGIFYTYDGGGVWGTYNTGLTNYNILTLSTNSGSIFYAGTSTAGAFRWVGATTGWEACNNGINSLSVRVFATSGANAFAGTNNSVCMTTNYGVNWVVKNEGFPIGYGISALQIFNNYIFAGTAAQSIWRRGLSEIITSVNNNTPSIPQTYSLEQNYPNPFNPSTQIKFSVPENNSYINLTIYDIRGKEVSILIREKLNAGYYETEFNGSNLSSGIYFYKLVTDAYTETKKMILIK